MIASIQLVDPHFFAIVYDFKRVGRRFLGKSKRADTYASALRVLELMRNAQVKRLVDAGVSEDQITEEQLGFALTWEQCVRWSDGHCSKRSYESIFPSVVDSGAARRFYVECHRRKVNGHEEIEVVCGEDGQPVLYQTIEEARANRREGGDVVNYVFFECGAVNDLIQELHGLSAPKAPAKTTRVTQLVQICEGTPSQKPTVALPNTPAKTPKQTQLVQHCEPEDRKTAREGSQNCTGNPRKTASNKNNKEKEESLLKEINIISATRAIALSQFDFSQPATPDAILQLSRLIYEPLPARYRTEEDKEAAYAHIDEAALALSTMSQIAELGLRTLAAVMAYQADESSPSGWRVYCRKNNPGFTPRLWHLESELVLHKTIQEFSGSGWWPEYLPRLAGLVETPPDIDLAALAGIPAHERVGMDRQTAVDAETWLSANLAEYGWQVQRVCVGVRDERGYAIEIYFEDEATQVLRCLRFYHWEDWALIVQADAHAPLGSAAFVAYLAEALRPGQEVA